MEQYIHTLIAVDSDFAPQPARVARFFDQLLSQSKFCPISDPLRSLPGLAVAKPSGRMRWMTNQITGEKISFLHSDRWNLDRPEAITSFIENSDHYTVMQSGEWVGKNRPIALFKTDGASFDESYTCTVRCELRPQPVSTSALDVEADPNRLEVPSFGTACTNETGPGIFQNPWTGTVIRVADASCARFWIEFEFGRFIYPKIAGNHLDVLNPTLVSWAEQCFGTKFAQGCRFW